MRRKNHGKRINKWLVLTIVFALLLLFVGILLVYGNQLLNKIDNVEISQDDEALGIKEEVGEGEAGEEVAGEEVVGKEVAGKEVAEKDVKKIERDDVINIALFGLDSKGSTETGRSDSIMIASLDKKHKKIKLTSIMRDTYIDIPGQGMDKINHAYAYGGPELAIKTINQNFKMDIREFVTVDTSGFEEIIDIVGGVEINVKADEVSHVACGSPGLQVLNGKEALAYSRIRKTGDGDYERTERQREVLSKMINKGMDMGITRYPELLDALLPHMKTNLSKSRILELSSYTLSPSIRNIEQFRIPADGHVEGQMIDGVSYVVPVTLEENIAFLKEFIYKE